MISKCVLLHSWKSTNKGILAIAPESIVRISRCFRLVSLTYNKFSLTQNPCCTLTFVSGFSMKTYSPVSGLMQVCQTSLEKPWWSFIAQSAWMFTPPNPPDTTTQMEPILGPDSPTCCSWCTQSIVQSDQPTSLCQGAFDLTLMLLSDQWQKDTFLLDLNRAEYWTYLNIFFRYQPKCILKLV